MVIKQELLLTPEKIKALMPVKDGYTYYESFGEAVAQAQLDKADPLIRKDEKERIGRQLDNRFASRLKSDRMAVGRVWEYIEQALKGEVKE